MAKSWELLKDQVAKIHTATGKITPPEPDDEFEAIRTEALKSIDRLGFYTYNKLHPEEEH